MRPWLALSAAAAVLACGRPPPVAVPTVPAAAPPPAQGAVPAAPPTGSTPALTQPRPVREAPAVAPGATDEELRARFATAEPLEVLRGKATYYADSLAGNPTASGEAYRVDAFTAAHRKLPFGSVLRVVDRASGRDVYVRVNDRGPFGDSKRIINLSRAAAESLGMIRAGVIDVEVHVLSTPR